MTYHFKEDTRFIDCFVVNNKLKNLYENQYHKIILMKVRDIPKILYLNKENQLGYFITKVETNHSFVKFSFGELINGNIYYNILPELFNIARN